MKHREISMDLHTHSSFSDGDSSPARLVRAAYGRRIKVLAITDHNVTGAHNRETTQMAENYGLTVIPGMELSALVGHILILGIDPKTIWGILRKNKIDTAQELTWLSVSKLLGICQQFSHEGAIVIPAHPGVIGGIMSLGLDSAKKAWDKKAIHGIEIHNGVTYDEILGRAGSIPYKIWSNSVRDFAGKLGIPILGNSDAHFASHVGRFHTVFTSENGNLTVEGILYSLRNRSTTKDGLKIEIREMKLPRPYGRGIFSPTLRW